MRECVCVSERVRVCVRERERERGQNSRPGASENETVKNTEKERKILK